MVYVCVCIVCMQPKTETVRQERENDGKMATEERTRGERERACRDLKKKKKGVRGFQKTVRAE